MSVLLKVRWSGYVTDNIGDTCLLETIEGLAVATGKNIYLDDETYLTSECFETLARYCEAYGIEYIYDYDVNMDVLVFGLDKQSVNSLLRSLAPTKL